MAKPGILVDARDQCVERQPFLRRRAAQRDTTQIEQLGIVRELTSRKRNRLFSYTGSIEIMSRGTELPAR